MSETESLQKYIVYFTDDTTDPIPVKAESRPDAFSIGRRYQGESVAAAVGTDGGEDFSNVYAEDFITAEDI